MGGGGGLSLAVSCMLLCFSRRNSSVTSNASVVASHVRLPHTHTQPHRHPATPPPSPGVTMRLGRALHAARPAPAQSVWGRGGGIRACLCGAD